MTVLVVVFHTAITYGSVGGWFYHELEPSWTPSSLLLTFFVLTIQAFFMGFFFLLAGYFTPASLERKGYARFIADRFLRLGLPLAAFVLILGPLTVALLEFARGDGFWSTFISLWRHQEFINGPLWFVQALLLFSLVYCAWRAVFGAALSQSERTPKPVPAYRWWLLSCIGVAAAALAIRQIVPAGKNIIGLQFGYENQSGRRRGVEGEVSEKSLRNGANLGFWSRQRPCRARLGLWDGNGCKKTDLAGATGCILVRSRDAKWKFRITNHGNLRLFSPISESKRKRAKDRVPVLHLQSSVRRRTAERGGFKKWEAFN
jgi:hypothetical protein